MQQSRLEQLLNFLKESPNDEFLNYALAMEFIGLNKQDKALEILNNLRIVNPNYLAVYYQLGKIIELAGQTEEALEAYGTGLKLAQKLKENKTASELQSAIDLLED